MTAVILCVIAAFAVLGCVISILMAKAAHAPAVEDAPVVVLGAGLVGDRPSRMLRERLDTAADHLETHPTAVCVVSGGQGSDEICTEASVMASYLEKTRGIDPARIRLEEASVNTAENLRFSMEILRRMGMGDRVNIVTQEFHHYRAAAMAKAAGADRVGALSTPTPWYLFLFFWARECAAVCRVWILGH